MLLGNTGQFSGGNVSVGPETPGSDLPGHNFPSSLGQVAARWKTKGKSGNSPAAKE